MNKTLKIIIIVFVVADIAAILGYYGARWYRGHKAATTYTTINIADAEKSGNLPPGFPKGLPVKMDGITDQKVVYYSTTGTTLTTISYILGNNVEQTANMYRVYFNANSYSVTTTVEKQIVILQASKAGDPAILTITLVPQPTGTSVTIAIITKNK